ncbi:MAG: right-handed parallel beta-helix repeat-containing protein, partial [Armatimonadetes bacterium]|nr:right-handed parallel beta-helix repeat-containing protein [Candidatus Hippobium faecium]
IGDRTGKYEKGYALLRKAQALEILGKKNEAKEVLKNIMGSFDLPQPYRYEATLRMRDMDGGRKHNNDKFIKDYIPAEEFFVSPKGNDDNPGTEDRPFATLEKAKKTISGKSHSGPVAINFAEGEYFIDKGIVFGNEDSGTRTAPIIYRGIGNVKFMGGKKITGFEKVTDECFLSKIPEKSRGKIYSCDLKASGIYDCSELIIRGFGTTCPGPTFQVFVNGEAQSLVRYPKKGFMNTDKVINRGDIKTGEPSVFEYNNPKFEEWDVKNLWLFGYFRFLWADRTIKVTDIDKEKKQLIMKEAYHWTDREDEEDGMNNDQGIIYYAFNIPEELSEPGEYWLDRENCIIYIVSETDMREACVEVNTLNEDMFALENVSYVRFENIHFDMGRKRCFEIKDCSDTEILGCRISRFASDAVNAENIYRVKIFGCEICDMGRGGILFEGGDRDTLSPSDSIIENCSIHDFGKTDRTYTPAILIRGVGMKALHNEMFNAPSSAMRVEGNEMYVEYNDFHNLCQESDDQGCIDVFLDFTYRGNYYRFNYIHHNGMQGRNQAAGQGAIRFDDAISGMVVYGNIIEKSATGGFGGVQINSGRDNIIDNNIFIDCESAWSGGYHPNNDVWKWLRENRLPPTVRFNDFYKERYPELKNVLDEEGVNYYFRNILIGCKNYFPDGYMVNVSAGSEKPEENNVRKCFQNVMLDRDMLGEDYSIDEKVYETLTFRQIPFSEIGNYESRYSCKK